MASACGQIREQSQAMARAMMAVRRASARAPVAAAARREPSRQLLSRPPGAAGRCRVHAPVCVRPARCRAGPARPRNSRSAPSAAAGADGADDRAVELRSCGVGRCLPPTPSTVLGPSARGSCEGTGGRLERLVAARRAPGSALAQRRRPSARLRRHDRRAGQRRPPCRCRSRVLRLPPARVVVAGLWLGVRRRASRARGSVESPAPSNGSDS